MSHILRFAFGRLRAACLFAACLLCAPGPAHAQALPPPIAPLWYASTVDPTAGTATFSIRFDRRPDLLTVDEFLRQADTFQYWTDTASTDPVRSTLDGINGDGPLGTQSVLTAVDIPATGRMTYIWPQDASYTGPRDAGGWGAIQGSGSYLLGPDDTVSFVVPLALLHAPDGVFNYVFETYQYGAGGETDYFGVSGQAYWVSNVPEPCAAMLLAGGLALLALPAAARRRSPLALPAQSALKLCPSDIGLFSKIVCGLRQMITSTTMVAR